jgi:hypothetical protein
MLDESKKTTGEKTIAAIQRSQATISTANKNAQIQQARAAAQVAAENEKKKKLYVSAGIANAAQQRQNAGGYAEADTIWQDDEGAYHGAGTGHYKKVAKETNVTSKHYYPLEEEAPAASIGAGMNTLGSAAGTPIAGMDPVMTTAPLRRVPPKMFGGKRVFTVPSNDYYKATLGRKKGQHWRSMVNGPLGEEIRQYALNNKDAPIIVEDEITGAMMYLRYGK